MDISSILLAIIVFLAVTALCVILFERLGFGAILGFIAAGIIIGPHTPGPVPVHAVDELQSVAEFGVVLFMFTVGLEMRPDKVWDMRRLIFGLGSAQMLVSAALLTIYLVLFFHVPWATAIILGLALSMSSTAIVMATMGDRGELTTEHGKTTFAILMAQDLWIVPVMALVPILAHKTTQSGTTPFWEKLALVVGVIVAIFVVGRYLLPTVLGYCAKRRQMDAFGIVLFLAVIVSAMAVEHVGISMTLGAFLLGMLLSASDFRYQIEATVAPFKSTLMGLFFIAVGMSIDIGALMREWMDIIVHVPIVLVLKSSILIGLVLAFGISRPAAIRTGFYLSQVGEFAFVLLGAASVAGLLTVTGHTLAMLVVAVSMVATPFMVKTGDYLAKRLHITTGEAGLGSVNDLTRHVVIIGYEEVGKLIGLMLEKANIPYIAFDSDISIVLQAKRLNRPVHFGDMFNPTTQEAARLSKAAAVYVTSRNINRAKGLAITLHRLYPNLNVFVRVRTINEQDELVAKGIKNAGTGYIESTLVRGSMLLQSLGVSEDKVREMVNELHQNDYAVIRSDFAKIEKNID
jgi:glutathione-regulated potassium-efflux system ancillary protein KefC